MNELFVSLHEKPGLLRAALDQRGGPDLNWLARSTDHHWLLEALETLVPLGGVLAGGRLPMLESEIWYSHGARQIDGPPGDGSWVAFLEMDKRGLLVPDDSGDRCWSVFLATGGGWAPVRLFFDAGRRSLRRAEVNISDCMIGQKGECIPLSCSGQCDMYDYAYPVPSRKCACRAAKR